MAAAAAGEGVLIPLVDEHKKLKPGERDVHILPSDLPDDEAEAEAQFEQILSVLQGEIAHPYYWIEVAEMYYRKGQTRLFQRLLEVLLSGLTDQDEEMEKVRLHIYGGTPEGQEQYHQDLVRVHNKLAAERAMAALTARRERDANARVPLFDEAKRYFDDAARVRGGDYQYDEETMALQGWASLMAGDNWEAADYFLGSALEMAEKGKRTNLLAMLGLAIAGFNDPKAAENGQQGVRRARKLLGKVIQQYPACPADVRLAFGLCCYRLGEMDRARAAFQRTLAMAPGHKTALLALARTELAEADPKDYPATLDRVIRMQTAAYTQDRGDAVALNSLTTYYLHKWFPLPARAPLASLVEGQARVSVQADGSGRYVKFEHGDMIRIGSAFTARVVEASDDGTLLLNREYHARGQEEDGEATGLLPVYRKNFREALLLAEQAIEAAELPGVRAEALYLKARVLHQLDDFEDALQCYRQAVQQWPELAPAQFGLAQMLAAQARQLQLREQGQEAQARLEEAVSALGKVLDRAPNDPDALTLLGLLLAERPGQGEKQAALERLKKAVELRPEVTEAWVALAQVHQRSPGVDMKEALRCLQEAERLLLARREAVPAAVLSNLGALLHLQQGRAGEAHGYYVRALQEFARSGRGGLGELERQYLAEEQPIVQPANAVFWRWETTPVRVQVPAFGATAAAVVEGEWTAHLKVGDHVKLLLGPGARDAFVTEVAAAEAAEAAEGSSSSIPLAHAFLFPALAESAADGDGAGVPVAQKVSRGLLRHETLPTVFNLAMIQQDTGEAAAARELFLAITRQYPSYVAAYAQLGLLAHAEGKAAEAQEWLDKAQKIAPGDKDVAALRGKMEMDAGKRDQAQRHFEPLNKEGDSYAMVALGNLYFLNAMTVPDKAHHMAHARTYHSKVLKKAPGNAYAAHGLGLVLAEEFGKVEDARAVLQAIREKSGDKPDEILVNIAHLFTAQGQRNAAIHCYETFLKKKLLGTTSSDPLLHGKVLEYVGHAHYLDKRYEPALRASLKALHLHPTRAQGLCNVALILEEWAIATFKRVQARETKSLAEARRAEMDVHTAMGLYARREAVQVYAKARDRAKFLRDNVPIARKYVEQDELRLQSEAAEKAARAKEVAEELRKREDAKRAQEEERERQREAARQAALAREEELRKLTSRWAQEPKEEAKRKSAGGSGGTRGEEEAGSGSEGDGSEVDEPLPASSSARPRSAEKKEGAASSSSSSDSDSDSDSSSSSSDASLPARMRRQQQLAAEKEQAQEGEGSDDEAYGIRPANPRKDRERAAAAAAAASSSAMEVDGEEGRDNKRKQGEEGGDGGAGAVVKKRRIQRGDGGGSSSEDEEEELDLGPPVTTPAAAAAPAPASPAAAAPAVATGANPAAPTPMRSGESPAVARRRVAVDEDEEEE